MNQTTDYTDDTDERPADRSASWRKTGRSGRAGSPLPSDRWPNGPRCGGVFWQEHIRTGFVEKFSTYWCDLVWFAANHPELHLAHLEQRMRQTGHWKGNNPLTIDAFMNLAKKRVDELNIEQGRREVEPFIRDRSSLTLWSRNFFYEVISRIELV